MSDRQRLPHRRMSVSEVLNWNGRGYLCCFGFSREGKVREVFIDGMKDGADLGVILDDACIQASLLLQFGLPADKLAHRLSEIPIGKDSDGREILGPASPIGAILSLAAKVEAELGEQIRQSHEILSGPALCLSPADVREDARASLALSGHAQPGAGGTFKIPFPQG